ncbi:MAG: EscU/YscU/HrcU family type III secretion system export apparatus switch protein [Tuberibacillus sp.]
MKKPIEKPIQAIALKYRPEQDDAPYVAAKGSRETARKIIETAKRYGIPVQEDETLATLLMALDVGESIPPELYQVVAEIFSFIYKIDKDKGSDPD